MIRRENLLLYFFILFQGSVTDIDAPTKSCNDENDKTNYESYIEEIDFINNKLNIFQEYIKQTLLTINNLRKYKTKYFDIKKNLSNNSNFSNDKDKINTQFINNVGENIFNIENTQLCNNNFDLLNNVPRLIPEEFFSRCYGCNKLFGTCRWKYNCKVCGYVFCFYCSWNIDYFLPFYDKVIRI